MSPTKEHSPHSTNATQSNARGYYTHSELIEKRNDDLDRKRSQVRGDLQRAAVSADAILTETKEKEMKAEEKKLDAFEDPDHKGNSEKYHTGKICIEDGCDNKAGTAWSPYWCFKCNVTRMNSISESLSKMIG